MTIGRYLRAGLLATLLASTGAALAQPDDGISETPAVTEQGWRRCSPASRRR